MLIAAMLIAVPRPALAQPQPSDVLAEQLKGVSATTFQLEVAFNAEDLCLIGAYTEALDRLRMLVGQARATAQAAVAAGGLGTVNADLAAVRVAEYQTLLDLNQRRLENCERRSLADRAFRLSEMHRLASLRCDRAAMRRLLAELEELLEQARMRVELAGTGQFSTLSQRVAERQFRYVLLYVELARPRVPSNCPPDDPGVAEPPPPMPPPPGAPAPPPVPTPPPPDPPTPPVPVPPPTPPPPAPPPPQPPPAPPGSSISLPDHALIVIQHARYAAAHCDRDTIAAAVWQLGALAAQAQTARERRSIGSWLLEAHRLQRRCPPATDRP